MTMLALVAGKGSPGVTTAAALLAAATAARGERPLLVELDPAGGTLALDAQVGLDPGLLSLAAAARHGLDESLIEAHSQTLPNGVSVLLAPTSPLRARSAVTSLAGELATLLPRRPGPVVVDCGRWDGADTLVPILAAADSVIVLLRPTIAGTEHVRTRLAGLMQHNPRLRVVSIGEAPYPPPEVAAALGVPLQPALADDSRAAHVVRSGAPLDRWLRRTALVRSARSLVDQLLLVEPAGAPA
jgi:cellulose biosynthesis protein BcsQ